MEGGEIQGSRNWGIRDTYGIITVAEHLSKRITEHILDVAPRLSDILLRQGLRLRKFEVFLECAKSWRIAGG